MCKNDTHWLWLGMVLLSITAGCAPAYHAYPCGGVPYGYCPESPLPFTNYCGCPTPRAAETRYEQPIAPAQSGQPPDASPVP